ncbi:MAG: C4-dicarboxylate TRAP transporter substrate-binding protein [Lautropia sp.]
MSMLKAALLSVGILLAATPASAQHKLRLGSVLAPSDPLQVAAEGFKKAVESRTQGKLVVQLFPSSQLGDTQDMMDGAAAGANIGTFVEASRVSVHVPEFNVLIAPYAFASVDDLARFVQTPTFEGWNERLRQKTGLTLLSFNWYQGPRHLLTKKAVGKPADLAGIKMRTIGQPLWVETIRAMGATPTPMAWAEVYPALQTGVLDAAEAQPAAIWGAKLHEVVKHVTLTSHIHLMSGLIVSDRWLQSLPADVRTVVSEEARRWGASALKANVDGAGRIFDDIRKAGVAVDEIDVAPFREAVKPVYAKLNLTQAVEDVRKALAK